jgi:Ca2+-binding RTX toxin-like protein
MSMARITFRSFWSFISRRQHRPHSPRAARPRFVRRLPLALERLEDLTLPSLSVAYSPDGSGKNIVRFDTDDGVDNLVLRLNGSGQLEYNWNSTGFNNDLNNSLPTPGTSLPGTQPLSFSLISRIDVYLYGGNDTLTLDNTNGSVVPTTAPYGIIYNGGTNSLTDPGTDTLVESLASNMVLTDSSLTLGVGGAISLVSVERANLTCGNFGNTMNASAFSGDVTLTGGNGKDFLSGGSGNDLINGLNGADVISGGLGNNTLDGGLGPDTVMESGDVDFALTDSKLTFGTATDTLTNIENANLTGGPSANSFTLTGWSGTAALDGGGGLDTVVLSQAVDMTLTNRLLTRSSGGGSISLTSIERAKLTGGDGGNRLDASAFSGNATLVGGAGNDTLTGGSGNDTLTGNGGQNSLVGGPGFDTVAESADVDFTLTDSLLTFGAATDALTSIENANLTGGAGNNNFNLTAWTGSATIDGGGGTSDSLTNHGTNVSNVSFSSSAATVNFLNDGQISGALDVSGLASSATVSFLNDGQISGAIDVSSLASVSFLNDGLASGDLQVTGQTVEFVNDGQVGSDLQPATVSLLNDTNGDGSLDSPLDNVIFLNDNQFNGSIDVLAGVVNFTNDNGGTITGGVTVNGATVLFVNKSHAALAGAATVTASNIADFTNYGSMTGPVTATGGTGANSLVNLGSNVAGLAFTGGPGPDVLVNTADNVTGIQLTGLGGNDKFVVSGMGLQGLLDGGTGDDTYFFEGNVQGDLTVNENPQPGDTNTLDFSPMTNGPVTIDIASLAKQAVATGLSLTLSSGSPVPGIENVVGTAFGDTILGNDRANVLLGADQLDDRYVNPAGWNGVKTQVVLLDFDTYTVSGDHVYMPPERDAIQQQIAADYAEFHYVFTQSAATAAATSQSTGGGGQYATIFFNKTPPNGLPGGAASGLDFRNTDLGGTASIQVNGILGAPHQPADTPANWIALSAKMAAHELAHLSGAGHTDAYGPIGFGIHDPPGAASFNPAYPGPAGGFETYLHIISSPDSAGTDRFSDTEDNLFFSEREAVKLAFSQDAPATPDGKLLVQEQAAAHGTQATAQPIGLTPMVVPNTLRSGLDVNKQFAVLAVDVLGAIGLVNGHSETDYYAFANWRKGDLINMDVISSTQDRYAGVNNNIDSVISVYDANGNLVAYYGSGAVNDDQPESTESSIVDLQVPADGTYYVQVSTFAPTDAQKTSPTSLYNPANPDSPLNASNPHFIAKDDVWATFNDAYNNTDVGKYELFIYRFDTGNMGDGGDTLQGGGGDDTLTGGAGANVLDGGSGTNTVQEAGDVNFTLSATALTGPGQDTLTNIQKAVLTGGAGANIFTIDKSWGGTGTIDGGGGSDTLIGPDVVTTWTVTALNAGTLAGAGTVAFSHVANLTGGAQNDTFVFADGQGVSGTIDGGGGTNTLDYSAYSAAHPVTVNLAAGTATNTGGLKLLSIQNVTGGAGNDALTGDSQANVLTGGAGDDTITGGMGNDTIDGGAGTNTLVEQGDVNFILTNSSLTLTDSNLMVLASDTLTSIEQAILTGGASANTINASAFTGDAILQGLGGNDTLIGGPGHDILAGGDGDDQLSGGAGNNILIGGAGADTLTATGGNNILIGGTGADTLTGSAGNDILIAGYTMWDTNYTALRAILQVWTANASDSVRRGNISGTAVTSIGGVLNGVYYLNASTVFTDSDVDKLIASGGIDWYFVDLDSTNGTPKDKITGNTGGSTITGIG